MAEKCCFCIDIPMGVKIMTVLICISFIGGVLNTVGTVLAMGDYDGIFFAWVATLLQMVMTTIIYGIRAKFACGVWKEDAGKEAKIEYVKKYWLTWKLLMVLTAIVVLLWTVNGMLMDNGGISYAISALVGGFIYLIINGLVDIHFYQVVKAFAGM